MRTLKCTVNKIREKLRDRSGETITETLVSMLIVVLSVTMLAGAIVAAARVNAGAEDHTVYVNETDGAGVSSVSATVQFGTVSTGATVKSYTKDSGSGSGKIYYYE